MVRPLVLAGLFACCAAVAGSAPPPGDSLPIDAEIRQANRQAADAEAEQARLEKSARDARDKVARLHAEQLAAAQGIAAAEARISTADARSRLIGIRLAGQRRQLAERQAPVSALLSGLAIMAHRPPILLLADGGSADELVKLRLLIAATTPAIRARTTALAGEMRRGEQLQHAALAVRGDMVEARNELARKRRAFAQLEGIAASLADRRGAAAFAAGDAALTGRDELGRIQGRAGSMRSAQQMARELATLDPAPLLRTNEAPAALPFAYRLPADARVSDGFAEVSDNGIRSRGLTLQTRRGGPLVVPADGTILFSGPFRDYDGVVIIDHGGGWTSVLVNAGSRLPRGSRVRAGAPLGTALGAVEVQLQRKGELVSPAIIAGSSQKLSNGREGG